MKPTLRFAVAAGAVAIALALALAACGGSSDSDGVASLTDTAGTSTTESQGSDGGGAANREDFERAQLEYARCMREHGVDMPDPRNGRFELESKKRDRRKMARAQEACGDILENARPPQFSVEQEAELREAGLDYAKCMREHGIDMPDPQFPEGGGMLMRMPQGAENDPQFEEAQETCGPILEDAKVGRPSGQDPS